MKPLSSAVRGFGERLAHKDQQPSNPTRPPDSLQRKQRHARIPLWWFEAIEDALTLRVLSAITLHANEWGTCYPSRRLIAALCHCTVQTVSAKTGWLEEHGFLRIERRRRLPALYTVNRTDPRGQPRPTAYGVMESKDRGQEVRAATLKESIAVDREQTTEHTPIEQDRLEGTTTNEERHRMDCDRIRLLREKAARIAEQGPLGRLVAVAEAPR